MYEQLDGILTWGDLRCASSVEARQPWVPQLGPYVPQLGPSRPIFLSQKTSKRLPEPIVKRFRTPPGGPGSPKTQKKRFFCISRSATDNVQIVQISPWEVPKRPPRRAQEQPGTSLHTSIIQKLLTCQPELLAPQRHWEVARASRDWPNSGLRRALTRPGLRAQWPSAVWMAPLVQQISKSQIYSWPALVAPQRH